MRKIWRVLFLFTLVVVLISTLSIKVIAQNKPSTPVEQPTTLESIGEGFPVTLDGQAIFLVRNRIGSFNAEERAKAITGRLEKIADDESLSTNQLTIKVDPDEQSPSVVLGNTVIVTITPQDAKLYKGSQTQLAKVALESIREAIERYRLERQPDNLLRYSISTLIASLSAFLLLSGIWFISRRMFPKLQRSITALIPSWRIQNYEVISSQKIGLLFLRGLQIARFLVILTLIYFYLTFVLRLFPWTRQFGDIFLNYFLQALKLITDNIARSLPNIFTVLLIVAITYYLIKAIKPFFTSIERGSLVLQGFYTDWAQPTYNIVKFLIFALAAVIAFPYLPGFHSPAFQGISVFLGVLFSLGSTTAIANIVGGVILIYTRAFGLGDRIAIGDVTGDVIEKSLLVTRIRTPTNQIITIPNSSLLNTNVVNFSVSNREFNRPLILQTTITLGYDLPWTKVYQTLIEAALATKSILNAPEPFVLQTSLDDFYVSYQLNAYTAQPNQMLLIYSELHQNIQDKCNEVGIEIMSPHYSALRDGNHTTIPENYLPLD